jgi:hypothetical protein
VKKVKPVNDEHVQLNRVKSSGVLIVGQTKPALFFTKL